jgi:signal-transduction protein with cAMP-binding, CBS, and nucleotidyltransferase domain
VGAEADELSTAIRTMVSSNVKRLPVLRRGRLVGILTFTDFARVEERYTQAFREALADASQQARRKFESRLPTRAPEYTFI